MNEIKIIKLQTIKVSKKTKLNVIKKKKHEKPQYI